MSDEPKLPPCPHCGGEAERFGCHAHGWEPCGVYWATREAWEAYCEAFADSKGWRQSMRSKKRKEGDGGQ